jgi:hypothetical protein
MMVILCRTETMTGLTMVIDSGGFVAVLEDFVEKPQERLLGPFAWRHNRTYWVREWCVHSVRDQFCIFANP